jgi:hypothetical protein
MECDVVITTALIQTNVSKMPYGDLMIEEINDTHTAFLQARYTGSGDRYRGPGAMGGDVQDVESGQNRLIAVVIQLTSEVAASIIPFPVCGMAHRSIRETVSAFS